MSLDTTDLRTMASILVQVDEAMQECGISLYTRDAVRTHVIESVTRLALKGSLQDMPTLMVEAVGQTV